MPSLYYDWSKQTAWLPGAWFEGAWLAGAFFPGAWLGGGVAPGPSMVGMVLWFDAADAASLTLAGSAVASWADKSGNQKTATAAGAARPTLQAARQNSLNAVRFTQAASERMFLASPINLSTARTILCVAARSGPAGTGVVELLGSSTSTSAYGLEWWTNTNLYSSGTNRYTQSNAHPETAFAQLSVDLNASAGHFFMNGAALTQSAGSTLAITGIYDCIGYGDSTFGNFELAEMLVYDTVLSDVDRQAAELYLKTKWATP